MDTTTVEPTIGDVSGHVDHLGVDGASGWLCDLAQHNKRLSVEALFDGKVVARIKADAFRSDLLELEISDGHSGFHLEFPEECFDGGEHDVALQIAETGKLLTQGFVRLSFPRKPVAPRVYGLLEHVDSSLFISGWALSDQNKIARVQVAVNGAVVASKEACMVRPDVVAAGFTSGYAGFRIAIPPEAITRLESEIIVTVDGEPLPGSPRCLSFSRLLDVRVEEARHGKIYIKVDGWPGKTLAGRLFQDGIPVAEVELNRPQKEITQAHKGHEGRWDIPDHMQDGQPHVYYFEISGGKAVARSDAVILSYPQYLMHIDYADTTNISGWAVRRDSAVPLVLDIYAGDHLVSRLEASAPRPDVQQHCDLRSAACGFELKLETAASDSACDFKIRDAQTGIAIAEVFVAYRYEALAEIATDWAREIGGPHKTRLRSVLAPLVMKSVDETAFHFCEMPKVRRTQVVEGVDVVIPIYGGYIETAECLESVLSARNKTLSRVIIVNDCSPDPQVNDLVDALERRQREDLVIIRRTQNGGFSQAVNLGMVAAGDKDVILLNADTVVQDGWIDRLVAASNSDPFIGTVTPLSNNGEIVTVPYPCKSLPVYDLTLARQIDQAAAQVNAGNIVDIPVAVGFCMFIRRACLEEIDFFDAVTWGRGYGEEVDFCLKAKAQGWRHVVATDTFVVHRGGVSFGDEKLKRIIESARKISERYPFYDQLIQRFIARDSIAPARRSINLKLISGILGESRILHVTHSFGGGTEKYVRDVAALQAEEGLVPLVLRFDTSGQAELEIDLSQTDLVGFFSERHIERYTSKDIENLKLDIGRLKIKRLHLHGPFGMPLDFLNWLTTSFPFNATIHDYAWICPRVTLTQAGGRYCGEPTVEQCDGCISLYSAHAALRNTLRDSGENVEMYRQNLGAILCRAEQVYAGAEDVVQRLRGHGMEANYHVTPHPELEAGIKSKIGTLTPTAVDGHVRVALFGGISDIKGFHQLIACAKHAHEKALPITFIIFGYTVVDIAKYMPNIIITGKYEEHELDELVQFYRPNISFFPNQWPETYSYTLSHSFRLGLWPVTTDIGAPAERIKRERVGSVYPLDSTAEEVCRVLLNLGLDIQVHRSYKGKITNALYSYRNA